MMHSVSSPLGHTANSVRHGLTVVPVFLVLTDVEEVLSGILSEWIVRVLSPLMVKTNGSLDIPEDVVRNGSQDSVTLARMKTLLVTSAQVLNIAVLLTRLENTEFLVKHVLPLVNY